MTNLYTWESDGRDEERQRQGGRWEMGVPAGNERYEVFLYKMKGAGRRMKVGT